MCVIESFKFLNSMIPFFMKIRKNKNPKTPLCGYNAKKSSRLIRLYIDRYRPLESSIYLFSLLLFMCNAALLLFSLLLIGILLLRPYELIKTSDSY